MADLAHPPGAEVRVTPWIDVSHRQEWADSRIDAYRIWQRASQWGWEQRHEWRYRDGGVRAESWIRGSAAWCPDAQPVETADAV
jgi:hypothetical protein